MRQAVNYIRDRVFDFLFSDLCYLCRSERRREGGKVCGDCERRLEFVRDPKCVVCGRPFFGEAEVSHTCGECIKEKRHYGKARSVFVYDDIVRRKIIEYKFLRNVTLSKVFGDYVLDYINDELSNDYDMIIPVPLHKKRLKERYFNQALLLVTDSEKRNQIRVDKYSLKRIRYTKPQVLVRDSERAKNVKGAFIVDSAGSIEGKRVLVVDDIFTTGATVNECSKVLKEAGAKSVDVLTLAKTVIF
jgi:ComF family protein